MRFTNNCRFSTLGLDESVKSLDQDDFKYLGKEFPDKWQFLSKKLPYPYE